MTKLLIKIAIGAIAVLVRYLSLINISKSIMGVLGLRSKWWYIGLIVEKAVFYTVRIPHILKRFPV